MMATDRRVWAPGWSAIIAVAMVSAKRKRAWTSQGPG